MQKETISSFLIDFCSRDTVTNKRISITNLDTRRFSHCRAIFNSKVQDYNIKITSLHLDTNRDCNTTPTCPIFTLTNDFITISNNAYNLENIPNHNIIINKY